MLEKRRILEYSNKICSYLVIFFFISFICINSLCFFSNSFESFETYYKIILYLNVTISVYSGLIIVFAIFTWIFDTIQTVKIILLSLLKIIVVNIFTIISMLIKEISVYGVWSKKKNNKKKYNCYLLDIFDKLE